MLVNGNLCSALLSCPLQACTRWDQLQQNHRRKNTFKWHKESAHGFDTKLTWQLSLAQLHCKPAHPAQAVDCILSSLITALAFWMSQSQSSPQEQDASEQQAWALLLQHPAMQADTPSICRLLCVSDSMRQMIHDHVHGQLHVSVSAEHDTSSSMGAKLSPWLRSHAALLKSLSFTQLSGLECSRPEQQQQFAHVPAGLAAAAQHGAALQIRSLTSNICGQVLLEALPLLAPSLTHLGLGPFCTDELHKLVTKTQPGSSMPHRELQDTPNSSSNTVAGVGSTSSQPTPPPPPAALAAPAAPATVAAPAPAPVAAAAVTALVAAQAAGSTPQQPAAAAAAAAAEAAGSQLPMPAQQQVPHWATLLACLPGLSCLTLKGYAANTLLPAVQPCTQLHSLTLCNLLCSKAQLLHNLPPQLQVGGSVGGWVRAWVSGWVGGWVAA
jgi:hypothetical protein